MVPLTGNKFFKMNKILLIIFFSASKILALDLTFELVYESTDISVGDDLTGSFYGSIINTSSDSISVAVISRERVLLDGWSASICLGEICYHESIDSASVNLQAGDTTSFGVIAWTNGSGDGTIELDIFNLEYPNDNIILELLIDTEQLALIGKKNDKLQKFMIHSAYPNPFNPVTSLRYDLSEDGLVNITIYDMMGRQISTLFSGQQTAGYNIVQWNATNTFGEAVSAGLYLYTIHAGKFTQTRKMVLLK